MNILIALQFQWVCAGKKVSIGGGSSSSSCRCMGVCVMHNKNCATPHLQGLQAAVEAESESEAETGTKTGVGS